MVQKSSITVIDYNKKCDVVRFRQLLISLRDSGLVGKSILVLGYIHSNSYDFLTREDWTLVSELFDVVMLPSLGSYHYSQSLELFCENVDVLSELLLVNARNTLSRYIDNYFSSTNSPEDVNVVFVSCGFDDLSVVIECFENRS